MLYRGSRGYVGVQEWVQTTSAPRANISVLASDRSDVLREPSQVVVARVTLSITLC